MRNGGTERGRELGGGKILSVRERQREREREKSWNVLPLVFFERETFFPPLFLKNGALFRSSLTFRPFAFTNEREARENERERERSAGECFDV